MMFCVYFECSPDPCTWQSPSGCIGADAPELSVSWDHCHCRLGAAEGSPRGAALPQGMDISPQMPSHPLRLSVCSWTPLSLSRPFLAAQNHAAAPLTITHFKHSNSDGTSAELGQTLPVFCRDTTARAHTGHRSSAAQPECHIPPHLGLFLKPIPMQVPPHRDTPHLPVPPHSCHLLTRFYGVLLALVYLCSLKSQGSVPKRCNPYTGLGPCRKPHAGIAQPVRAEH